VTDAFPAEARRRWDTRILVIAAVVGAALLFVAASAFGGLGIQSVDVAIGKSFPCTVLNVTDGDGPGVRALLRPRDEDLFS